MMFYRLVGIAIAVLSVLCIAAVGRAVVIDEHRRAECEARGGVYSHPRDSQPLCLKRDALLEGAK